MTFRTHVLVIAFFITSLSFPFLYYVKGYVSDPLNLLGRSRNVYQDLNRDDRVRAALVSRNGSYNSVILGSSMLKRVNENTLTEGKNKYINISTNGSTIHERTTYLEHILDKKRLRSVVFSMDHGLSLHRRDFPVNTDPDNWMYLFDQTVLNDFKIYFEEGYFKCVIGSPFLPCDLRRMTSKKSNKWYEKGQVSDWKISGIDGWRGKKGRWKLIKSRARRIINSTPFVKKDSTDYIADLHRLKDIAKENRGTKFILVVPPYSMLYLKLMYSHNNRMFSEYRNFLSNIYQVFEKSPNVRLLYLDGNPLTSDLNNYIDMRHYTGPVLDYLIDAIKSDENHLTENFSMRFHNMENSLQEYDYSEFMTNYEEN